MRSALICLFIAVTVQGQGSHAEQDDDFKPTPIPLNTWTGENQMQAGTLQEFIKTDLPPTVAAIPAHYWEDALRHSVYLSLVRDKIDQLIAKGEVISPNSKPDGEASKEIDDHDLWEKIKSAPFDRVQEEPLPPSDTIILARGRLLEEKTGYRFAEGDGSAECTKDNCTQAVKAYWSVKRTRQGERTPGKYHYELTFSVTSQSTKSLRKQYENPARTFTIRENEPTVPPPPPTYRYQRNQEPAIQHGRIQRAVWVHKNIGPAQSYHKRQGNGRGLDRIFSSLFSDEDNYDDTLYRPKPNTYAPPPYQIHSKHSKISRYVSEREPFHQKKIYTYSVKPPSFRYPRPPLQPPPLPYTPHTYFDVNHDSISHLPIDSDNRPIPSSPIKTTKPAVLPTPLPTNQMFKDPKGEELVKTTIGVTEYTTREPETSSASHKTHTHKQTSMKVNYLPQNIRPPIYNAPPGVFVTMDKKPFKPLPPIKSVFSKPHKNIPSDFRPSPQILDTTNTDHIDVTDDTAFRPISLNFTELLGTKHSHKNYAKPVPNKKPSKKHNNIRPIRYTTVSPEIITMPPGDLHSEIRWAEILAAFTKTTPMASQKENHIPTVTTDMIMLTETTPSLTTEAYEEEIITSNPTTSTISTTTTSTSTTTAKPKRTRPPPQFKKTEKIKKHKRVITNTTTTASTSRPTRVYPTKKISNDLMPQASSAATNGANSVRESKPIGPLGISSSTTTTSSTTTASSKSSTSTTSTTATFSRSSSSTTATTASSNRDNTNTTLTMAISSRGSTNSTSTTANSSRGGTTTTPTMANSSRGSNNTTPTTSRPRATTKASTTTITPITTTNSDPIPVSTQPKSKNRFRQSTLMQKGTSLNHDKWSLSTVDKNRTTTVTPNSFPLRRKASKFQGYIPPTTVRSPEKAKNKEDHKNAFSANAVNLDSDLSESKEDIEVKISSTKPSNEKDTTTTKDWNNDLAENIEIQDEENLDTSSLQEPNDSEEFIFPISSVSNNNSNLATDNVPNSNKTEAIEISIENNRTKCKKKKTQNVTITNDSKSSNEIESTSSSINTSSKVDLPGLFEEFLGFTMDDVTEQPKPISSTASSEPTASESVRHDEVINIGEDIQSFLNSLQNSHDKKSDAEYDDDNEDGSPFENDEEGKDMHEDYYDEAEMQVEGNQEQPFNLLELMAME